MVFKKKKKQISNQEENFDIEDIENWRGEPDLKFSYELLIMEQYRRTSKAGSQEMKKGWEERKESQTGSTVSIKVHPDTRKEFGECMNTLKNMMIGNIVADSKAKGNIKGLYDELLKLKGKYIEMEEKAWQEVPEHVRRYGSKWVDRWEHIKDTLNYDHIFGEYYLQESVEVYRRILEEITLLLHRMGYFKGEKI